jgi:two-component system, chemotaxis family, CheB/CheR fusion protein
MSSATQTASPQPLPPVLSGVRVLVIENDVDNLDMFAQYLQHCGAKVTTAQTGTAALRCLAEQHIDAIMTDLSALKGSGIEDFLQHVRGIPEYTRTPIIAVTGWQEKDVVCRCEAAFSAYLLKPVDLDDLSTTIINLVQKPHRSG